MGAPPPRIFEHERAPLQVDLLVARGIGDADPRERSNACIGWCWQRVEEEGESGHTTERHIGALGVVTVFDRHVAHGISRTDLTQPARNELAVGEANTIADGFPALDGPTDNERVSVRDVLNGPDGATAKVEAKRRRRKSRVKDGINLCGSTEFPKCGDRKANRHSRDTIQANSEAACRSGTHSPTLLCDRRRLWPDIVRPGRRAFRDPRMLRSAAAAERRDEKEDRRFHRGRRSSGSVPGAFTGRPQLRHERVSGLLKFAFTWKTSPQRGHRQRPARKGRTRNVTTHAIIKRPN